MAVDIAATGVEPMLTYGEAAKILRLGETRVKQLCYDGELPRVKVGGSVRIRASDLRAYIEARPALPAKPKGDAAESAG